MTQELSMIINQWYWSFFEDFDSACLDAFIPNEMPIHYDSVSDAVEVD